MIALRNIKMKPKLIGLFLLVGLIPLIFVGVWSGRLATDALMTKNYDQLTNVREIKKAQIEKFFAERQGDMDVLVETVETLRKGAFEKLEAVQSIKTRQIESYFEERQGDMEVLVETVNTLKEDAFRRLEAVQELKKIQVEDFFETLRTYAVIFSRQRKLQDAFADYDAGFREYGAGKSTQYQQVSAKYQEYLHMLEEEMGLSDLLFITNEGDIIASANQESEVWTNLKTGPYKDTNLAEAFSKVISSPYSGKEGVIFADFRYYEPSDSQAGFALIRFAPNTGERGRWTAGESIGCIAFQIPVDPINTIVQYRQGMGKTGETYLVGELNGETSYRSERVVKEGKIGQQKTGTDIKKALSGNSGIEVKTGSSGDLEIEAYDPLNIAGLNWAIISTMQLEEAIAPKLEGEDKDFYTKYITKYGYYDLFLIHPEGRVFYTVAHEADYGTNMVSGEYSSSNLGRLVQQMLETKAFGIADFEPYAPSNDEPSAFIAQPVMHNNEVEMLVALQLPIEGINTIVQERNGMGKTGETYLVGELNGETSYRSDRVVKEGKVGQQKTGTEIEKALSGNSGFGVKTGSSGDLEIEAYDPLNIAGLNWVIISTMQLEEAIAPKLEGEDEDFYTKYITKYGYYDLFLIHPEGRVFYTVAHEADYGTNMINGTYSNSNLGQLVQ